MGEICKENINEIAPYMQEITNNILKHNIDLPKEWTKGILCLLHKKESKEKCDNYRPGTLLKASYKILPIMITKRISPIMNLLTPELQTAYKKNRSTYDTLKVLRTLLNDQDSERTITLMDLTKAFDRTNIQLLFNILIKKGIPIEMVRLIIKTQKNTQLQAREKNKLGEKQEINRGIFQGSPLLALLFIIYTDQMMKEFDEDWKEKKEKMGEKKENKIIVRTEGVEKEVTEELYKQKEAKEKEEVYNIKIKTKGTKEINIEHTEYADDTQLINRCKEEEEDKLEVYKKHAERYDLEIQWKKNSDPKKRKKKYQEKY